MLDGLEVTCRHMINRWYLHMDTSDYPVEEQDALQCFQGYLWFQAHKRHMGCGDRRCRVTRSSVVDCKIHGYVSSDQRLRAAHQFLNLERPGSDWG